MPAVLDRRVSGIEAKKLDRVLKPFEEGGRYVVDRFDTLLKKYGEQWVAVRGRKVVAHSPSRIGLRRKLSTKGISPTRVYTTYLTGKKRMLIL